MATRRKRRPEWRRTSKGTWTLSIGQYGQRVRLFQNRKDGFFYREVSVHGRKDRRTLGTRDRDEAERLGQALASAMASGSAPRPATVLRLGELAARFVSEAPTFLDNAPSTQKDQRRQVDLLVEAFGRARDVTTFTEHDVRQYEAQRKAGGIRKVDGSVSGPVRQRSVQADIKLLKTILYWACTQIDAQGVRLLDRSPLEHVRVSGERNPKRPVADYGRFLAIRAAIRARQARYLDEANSTHHAPLQRRRALGRYSTWVRAELALWLLEETGRRRGSVRGLKWEDFNAANGFVVWSGDHDKRLKRWDVPYPPAFFEEVRRFQSLLGATDGFLFPSSRDPSKPIPRELISQWIGKAEEDAGLPKLDGGVLHPFRRKWRSERPHLGLKAVAFAGGWSDIKTMLDCYDQPEVADVLAVTSEPRKRGVATVGA